MKIYSWNINGVRSAAKAGFLKWLSFESPDILCLQEIRCSPSDLEDMLISPFDYKSYWYPAEKKGYSGVAVYSRVNPLKIKEGLGIPAFDSEGRTLIMEFPDFVLYNCYFPNSRRDHSRLPYKLTFCKELLKQALAQVKAKKNVLICGDFNIAHKEIDLKNPKTNIANAGFLPEERAWMDLFLKAGFMDTFRLFNQEAGHYTWWSNRPGVREKNVGWRLDYFAANEGFRPRIKGAHIHPDVYGSDHCPVSIEI